MQTFDDVALDAPFSLPVRISYLQFIVDIRCVEFYDGAIVLCDQMGESIYGRCVESGQTIVIDNVAEVISLSLSVPGMLAFNQTILFIFFRTCGTTLLLT